MVALGDVRRWDPTALDAAHRALDEALNRLLHLDTDLQHAQPPTGWVGATAETARPRTPSTPNTSAADRRGHRRRR